MLQLILIFAIVTAEKCKPIAAEKCKPLGRSARHRQTAHLPPSALPVKQPIVQAVQLNQVLNTRSETLVQEQTSQQRSQPVRQAQNAASQQVVRQVQRPQAAQQPVRQVQRVASQQVVRQTQQSPLNRATVFGAQTQGKVYAKLTPPHIFDYNAFTRAKKIMGDALMRLRPVETSNVQVDCLQNHNNIRALVNVQPLVWDAQLASTAQWWANELLRINAGRRKLIGQHSPSHVTYGENLSVSRRRGGLTCSEAVLRQWSQNEYNWYNGDIMGQGLYTDPSYVRQYGHFGAVIWPATTKLGCAIATRGGTSAIVCEYDPAADKGKHRIQFS
jgi:uncharacterized protein YkwD